MSADEKNPAFESESLTINDTTKEAITLKRSLGVPGGVALLVGTIIGSGIFATPKWVVIYSGSVGLSLVVWSLCGLISLLGALCYVELGLLIPKSGGEYVYLMEAFGPLPAFLFSWVYSLLLKNGGVAILVLVFGSYVVEPFYPGCTDRQDLVQLQKLLAVIALGVVIVVNCASVKWASRLQIGLTVAKMVAIVMLILTGIVRIAQGHVSSFTNAFKGTEPRLSVIGFAFYNALFSYDGWNNINYVIEEFKNPKRNLPLSIWIAVPVVSASYVLVNVGFLTVLSGDEVMKSNAVAVTLASRLYGVMAWTIPFLVACSVFGSVNGSAFAGGRLIFAAAREGHLPQLLAMIHTKQRTPLPALLTSFIICTIMVIPDTSSIASLLNAFSLLVWFNYGVTLSALLWLRYKKKDSERPYKVFIVFPCLLILLSIYLVVASFAQSPVSSTLCFLFVLAGIPVYFVFVRYKFVPGCIDRVTLWLQKFLNVALPQTEKDLL
ncbi:b(0,+)-type amino acid transporter 1-like [Actinia tenebrosa]|uniref:b(0,+)-type amino acid transporter 1 n=1 Tax=Actinia tenebrosa TaxID=6105 RepID=A0A6P8IHU5_ACTTE|nr:b(0,+)-type amino acid transporter 1-like [Actinia tenebrosa]